ncbi:uncharacterized protein LOC119836579 [Zerene cesonia]|uniref:uncharacterized protein LOC119836579 n=1 Tax=Zerene cesonia TaxID=33412 RepID=UPI0018E570D4|nr:uncharacterized protein LOC119836579 [Zerene cesonia]
MENHEKPLRIDLENRPYRYLQKMTKALSLPSNFKKIHLIDLIIARKRGIEDEVKRIITKAKQERVKSSQIRRQSKRKIMQDTENIMSRRLLYSPPITATPRHNQLSLQRLNKRRSLLKRLNESPNPDSNRILRSCNTRNIRNVIDIIRAHSSGGCMKIVSRQNSFQLPKFTVQLQPSLTLTPVRYHNMYHNKSTQSQSPAKRQRTVSGIYPIVQNDIQTNGVSLRRKDGTISKINAIVERRTYERKTQTDYTQDILNDLQNNQDIENTPLNSNNLFQNLSVTDSAFSEVNNSSIDNSFSEIRLEETMLKYESRLPKISDVFSKFSSRDYTQPLHIQVGSECEKFPTNTLYVPWTNSNPIKLESYYTFKSNLITNDFLQKPTVAHTISVFSTTTVVTAKVQPTATAIMHNYPIYPESFYRNEMDQRFANFLSCSEQEMRQDSLYSEELNNSSVSSVDTGQDIGASVTIPEMVEDAFEIISQDGDYLERIGMDSTKIQCVLCNWAGPTVIMECHLRKEHANQILKQNKSEWNITYTLGSLVSDAMWLSKVIEYNSLFYVLSAKYEDPDCFMVTLSSLSPDIIPNTGSITIYNKVSGEPHTWQGDIEPLPPNLPYRNHLKCLKLSLATLDLLPNSANLKLVNRELVMESPGKVVVGQPELNDIHIILFVRLLGF